MANKHGSTERTFMILRNYIVCIYCIVFLGGGILGCEGDGEKRPSNDDTDSDSSGGGDTAEMPFDCEAGGGNAGDECDENDLCNCDNVCGDQLFEAEEEAAQALITYCFKKCSVPNQDCGKETQACAPVDADIPVEEAELGVCVPIGAFAASDFEMPIFQAGVEVKPAEWVLTNKVNAKMGDTNLPKSNAAAGMVSKDGSTYQLSFVLAASAEELWSLVINVPQDRWEPGSYKVGGFKAHLYHSKGTGENLKLWYEGSAATGTLELTNTPTPCAGGGQACAKARGTVQLGILGFRTGIAPE